MTRLESFLSTELHKALHKDLGSSDCNEALKTWRKVSEGLESCQFSSNWQNFLFEELSFELENLEEMFQKIQFEVYKISVFKALVSN